MAGIETWLTETSIQDSTIQPRRNLNAYVSHLFLFTYIRLTETESSIHLKSLAWR